jgi:hypothetical protein
VLLFDVLYCYNKIEISHNGRREINRMCKKISRHLRHESSQVLGQQLQIVSVEEDIVGVEGSRSQSFIILFILYLSTQIINCKTMT